MKLKYIELLNNNFFKGEKKIFLSLNLLPLLIKYKKKEQLISEIIYFLEDNFDEVIMSSDTLNLCNTKEIFDIRSTNSYERGVLVNKIINNRKFKRSHHPFVSCISIGKKHHKVDFKPSIHGYGINSPYDYIYKSDFTLFTLDLPIMGTTIIHHCENLANVPYRYTKLFNQETINWDGERKKSYWALNVLYKELTKMKRDEFKTLWEKYNFEDKIEKLIIDGHIIRKVKVQFIVDEITKILLNDPYIWLGYDKKFNSNLPFFR